MRPDRLLPGLLAAAVLAGCSSSPVIAPPAMDVPAAFKQGAAFEAVFERLAPAATEAQPVPDAWWTLFNDPVLNALQEQLPTGNANLAASAAAVRIAQAAVASSRANLLPTVNLSTGASRTANVASSPRGTSYSVQGALASWEVDLWGRLAAGVDAANARWQASRHTLASVRLSLQASLAQTYFSLRSAEATMALLGQTVQAYEKSLELTQNRYAAGVASAADVAQAQTQLYSAQAQRTEAQLQRAQLEHALATLLGQSPAALELPTASLQPLPKPPQVPLQLPAQLLARRPDIAAAASQVQAANAQIGAAEAAFFPSLTLSANAGLRSTDLGTLAQSANKFWSLGPSLLWAAFDGGARQAASDAARASYDQTVAQYKQTVLTALQEVEDNLVAARLLQEEMAQQQAALASAQKALDIARNQYAAGTVGYLQVVTAQTSALGAQRSVIDLRNRQLAAVNQLLKNLAGRW